MARQSIAFDALNDKVSLKIPLTNVTVSNAAPNASSAGQGSVVTSGTTSTASNPTTSLLQWAEGTASRMIGGLPNGQNFPNGISEQGWMEVRARAFYLDPSWSTRINAQSSDANSKDIALILGFQTYMQYNQFQETQRMNVTLATMLAIMDEQNRRQQGL
jgi:hypothetical protein